MSDDLYTEAMALHKKYCDRKDKQHSCVGVATIRNGEVDLSCSLCGHGTDCPAKWQMRPHAQALFAAAGVDLSKFNAETQRNVCNLFAKIVKEIEHRGIV